MASDGTYRWDGAALAAPALPARLAALSTATDSPLLMLDVDAATRRRGDATTRYERFDQTIAVIKRAGVTKLAFVGNDRRARW